MDQDEPQVQSDEEEDPLEAEFAAEAGGLTRGFTTDADIVKLNLQADVTEKARQLLRLAPGVKFNSGRRDMVGQARAMAGNVARNRKWIEQTYRATPAIAKLQGWVNAHPEAKTQDAIAKGLEQTMNAMPDSERGSISRHLSGRAFDIQPNSCTTAQVNSLKPRKFLQKEGGLVIWHVDF